MVTTVVRLHREFYCRPTLEVAPELLGKFLIFNSPTGKKVGQIAEVEAYLGLEDPASHAFHGPTTRTEVMFGEAGFSYVYFIYGMYSCLNVITERSGVAGGVLIRALIPVEGIAEDQKTDGPGKLCRALGITTEQQGIDLVTSSQLYLEDRNQNPRSDQIKITPRIGIRKNTNKLWRFLL